MSTVSDYAGHDALALAALIKRGEASGREILDLALEGLAACNPRLNAVVRVMEKEARAQLERGLAEGPLAGVPYLLKDLNVHYRGVPTTNGSRLFADVVPERDSIYTERVRAAGLVVIGKSNTPEFGLNASTEPQLHGATRNPWSPARSAGGSSGGSAAAVAAGIVPVAHATDGGGSIRIPAAHCALFGLKPTRGRVTMGPHVGEGWSGLSTGHAVTRSVRDSAAILDATHGPWDGDPYRAPPVARPFLEEVGRDPGRLRIALWTGGLAGEAVSPECAAGARAGARLCEALGHEVETLAPDIDGEGFLAAMRVIVSCNVANVLAMRSEELGRPVARGEVETITARFAEEGARFTGRDYAGAVFRIHETGRRLAAFFERCDVLLSPTLADPPLPLGTFDMTGGDLDRYCERLFAAIPFTPLYNVTGCPAATLPLHWTQDGLPVGVQIGARFGAEALLFRLAAQIEAERPWAGRRAPLSP